MFEASRNVDIGGSYLYTVGRDMHISTSLARYIVPMLKDPE